MATTKITLNGQEFEVEEAVAAALQANGEAAKKLEEMSSRNQTLSDEIASLKLQADELTRKDEEARRKAEEDALRNKGKPDELEAHYKKRQEEIERQAREREERLANNFRDERLKAAVAGHGSLRRKGLDDDQRRTMVDDVVANLRQTYQFDVEKDRLTDGNGLPVEIDKEIDSYLATRPHLREPTATPGSGAGGNGPPKPAPKMISRAEFDAMTPPERHKWIKNGGKVGQAEATAST